MKLLVTLIIYYDDDDDSRSSEQRFLTASAEFHVTSRSAELNLRFFTLSSHCCITIAQYLRNRFERRQTERL